MDNAYDRLLSEQDLDQPGQDLFQQKDVLWQWEQERCRRGCESNDIIKSDGQNAHFAYYRVTVSDRPVTECLPGEQFPGFLFIAAFPKLRVAVRMVLTIPGPAVALQTIIEMMRNLSDLRMADPMSM